MNPANPPPITVEPIKAPATVTFRFAQVGSRFHSIKINGICRVTPIKTTIGITIGQCTSGDRTVIGFGFPAKINPNSRIKLNAVNPFTTTNTPTNSGCACQRFSAILSNAQNPPKGGNATKPANPTRKANPEIGRRDQSPPY